MSSEIVDSKGGGGEEVDLMDELLDSAENFDELNDVADDKSNKRKGSRQNLGSDRSGGHNSSTDRLHRTRNTRQVTSKNNKNGSMADDSANDDYNNSSSTDNIKRRKNKDSNSPGTSPRSSKKSLDDLTDEDELMDFEESSRPSSGDDHNTRDPSISDESRGSSRASSVSSKHSDKEEDDDNTRQDSLAKKEEKISISEKRKISMEDMKETSETVHSKGTDDASAPATGGKKKYDYITKINYLFSEARFFLMKSNNEDNINLSKSKGVWSTPPQNEAKLNHAVKECRNVILVYSVKESGKFCGFARVAGESRRDLPAVNWVLPQGLSARALGGIFTLDWISKKELSFNKTLHLYNPWNEGKSVKIGRDGQEIEPRVAEELCRLFPKDETVSLTSALLRSKKRAKASSSSSGGSSRGPIRRPLVMPGERRGNFGGDHFGSFRGGRGRGGGGDHFYGGRNNQRGGGFGGDRRGGRGRAMYVQHRGNGRADYSRFVVRGHWMMNGTTKSFSFNNNSNSVVAWLSGMSDKIALTTTLKSILLFSHYIAT